MILPVLACTIICFLFLHFHFQQQLPPPSPPDTTTAVAQSTTLRAAAATNDDKGNANPTSSSSSSQYHAKKSVGDKCRHPRSNPFFARGGGGGGEVSYTPNCTLDWRTPGAISSGQNLEDAVIMERFFSGYMSPGISW